MKTNSNSVTNQPHKSRRSYVYILLCIIVALIIIALILNRHLYKNQLDVNTVALPEIKISHSHRPRTSRKTRLMRRRRIYQALLSRAISAMRPEIENDLQRALPPMEHRRSFGVSQQEAVSRSQGTNALSNRQVTRMNPEIERPRINTLHTLRSMEALASRNARSSSILHRSSPTSRINTLQSLRDSHTIGSPLSNLQEGGIVIGGTIDSNGQEIDFLTGAVLSQSVVHQSEPVNSDRTLEALDMRALNLKYLTSQGFSSLLKKMRYQELPIGSSEDLDTYFSREYFDIREVSALKRMTAAMTTEIYDGTSWRKARMTDWHVTGLEKLKIYLCGIATNRDPQREGKAWLSYNRQSNTCELMCFAGRSLRERKSYLLVNEKSIAVLERFSVTGKKLDEL
jgi:hypothetical protein